MKTPSIATGQGVRGPTALPRRLECLTVLMLVAIARASVSAQASPPSSSQPCPDIGRLDIRANSNGIGVGPGLIEAVAAARPFGPWSTWTLAVVGIGIAFTSGLLIGVRRKRNSLKEELREKDLRFRQLAENVDQVFWLTEWQVRRVLYVSPAYERIWQQSCQSLYDDPRSWAACIHPDDKVRVVAAFEGETEHGGFDVEYRIVRADGQTRWIHDRAFPVRDASGRVYRVAGLSNDITERKLAEESLRRQALVLDTLYDGVVMTDLEANITGWNRGAERIYGYSKDDVLQKNAGMLTPGEAHDDAATRIIECVRNNGRWSGEVRFVRKDGQEGTSETVAVGMNDAAGDLIGTVEINRDITTRKAAEEAQRESEARLQAMFDNTTAVAYLKDTAGRYLFINQRFEKLFHVSREDLIGKTDYDVFPQETADAFRANDLTVLETGAPLEREELAPHDEGVHTYISVKFPICDAKGVPFAVGGISTDITERKRTEEQLKATQDRLRHLIRTNSAVIYTCRADGDFAATFVSENVSAVTGHEARQFVEESSFWADHIHPEDMSRVFAILAEVIDRDRHTYEYRFLHKEGHHIWVRDELNVIRNDCGEPVEIVGYLSEITERKRIEQALRESNAFLDSIVQNIPNMIFLKDARELKFVRFNKFGEELLGYSRHELIGKNDFDFFPEHEAEFFTRKDREVLENRRLLDIPEEEIQLKSGDIRILHTRKIPILDENGDPQYLLGISEDITERKKAELANAKLENQLRQAQKMEAVGTLAGGIAHEFENLLNAMFAYIGLAKNKLDFGHAASKSLDMVEVAAKQARGVTNALLTFCHAAPTAKSPFDLANAVRTQVRLLRGVLPRTIRVTDDLAPNGSLWVNGDETQLQQVLMNLAINARDAIDASGELDISLRDSSRHPETQSAAGADDRWAVLRVEDSGTGMTPETNSRIFEPFFTTKPPGRGTGLGMSIAHSIVTDHDGRIEVESQLGCGTRISVHLPCCKPPKHRDLDPDSRSRDGGMLIMIVEQDEYALSIMKSTLACQGYEVLPAADAGSAAAAFQTRGAELSLAVLDLDLPRHERAELLSILQRTKPGLPIVGVTGRPDLDIATLHMARDHVLRKPFQMHELISAVGRVLNRTPDERST